VAILAVGDAVAAREWIAEDGAAGEALGADEAARRHPAVGVDAALEPAVEALAGERAPRGEHAADLDAILGVRIGATAGGDRDASGGGAVVAAGRVGVVGVARAAARRGRRLVEPARGWLVGGGGVGRGQLGGRRDPDRRDGRDEVELPAVHPAVPAGLGPAGFGVDRGVRDDPGSPLRPVPGTDSGSGRARSSARSSCSSQLGCSGIASRRLPGEPSRTRLLTSAFKTRRAAQTGRRPPGVPHLPGPGGLGIASIPSTGATNTDVRGTLTRPAWFGLTAPWSAHQAPPACGPVGPLGYDRASATDRPMAF
jgi:hypothetical protein